MKTRRRTRTTKVVCGSASVFGNWYRPVRDAYFSRIDDSYEKTRDIYGLMPSTSLRLVRSKVNMIYVSGTNGGTPGTNSFAGFYSYGVNSHTPHKTTDVPVAHWAKDKKNPYYTNEILARTNPFRSDFSVPVMVKELVEVATMFKFLSRTLASTAGSAYLNYRFGWSAFIRDIQQLGGVTKVLERRLKEFQSLQQHGGLRRRVELDSYETIDFTSSSVVASSPAPLYVRVNRTNRWHTKVWGSARWFPAPGAWTFLDDLTPLESFNLAVRSVFDVQEISPQQVWDLIPWSWLIDYFVDIGSYLGAISHQALARAEYMCIMRETTRTSTGSIIEVKPSYLDASGSPGSFTVIKTRDPLSNQASLPSSFKLFNESEAKVILALLAKYR